MSTTDIERALEGEDLALSRSMIKRVLGNWDLITWNELLAEDIVLSVRPESIDFGQTDVFAKARGNLQVSGHEDAKQVLMRIYSDLKRGLCVVTEITSGNDAVLVGELSLESTKERALPQSFPIVIFMEFNSCGKIRVMTIAAIDLTPPIEAVQNAARTATFNAA